MIKINVITNNIKWFHYIKNPNNYLERKLSKLNSKSKTFKKNNIFCTLLLSNSKEIQLLNKKFRKKNKPTDVISFPFFTKNYLKKIKNKKCYIGDLAVSYEIINSRAKKNNFFLEFDKVWIHGLLHLVGYDHVKDKDYYKMFKFEKKIISLINY